MADGVFIVLEGGEGSGKSTQARLLGEWLRGRGVAHRLTREPGGTALGESIRELILNRSDLDVPPESELFLILAARAAFVQEVVRPALAAGEHVVSDRYFLSTLAYQGHGRGLDLDELRSAIAFATGGLRPDVTIVLDVPVSVGLSRQSERGGPVDRIESAGGDFRERVRRGYLELAAREPGVHLVDGNRPPDAVHEDVRSVVAGALPEIFGPGAV